MPSPLPVLLFALAAALPAAAVAQSAPPIKPGLWQVQGEREEDGRKAPDMAEQLGKIPPEMRAQIAAQMRQRGVEMGEGGTVKMCLSKASLEQGQWQRQHGNCKTEYLSRTAASWKWRSRCSSPVESESEGESIFESPEAYTVRTTTRMTMQGQPRTVQMTMKGTWLKADCGDVKPVSPKP